MNEFTTEELNRYSRHFALPGFGVESQQKLQEAKAIIIGAGGLGCPVLSYLAAAGVGVICIIDDDVVNVSNLQRQILYTVDDIGVSKANAAILKLEKLNPNLSFQAIKDKITSENALTILNGFDVVIDCTDSFATRYLLNDACVLLDIPLVYGSIFRYEGHVSVFNYKQGITYRDLFPIPPDVDSIPSCEDGGVLGVLPGIIGSIQANEALKVITGYAEPLSGKLFIFDAFTLESQLIKIHDQNQRKNIRSLIDYDDFCRATKKEKSSNMKEVTVQELKALLDQGADFQLIDVREPHEFEICEIGGELIPQAEIPSSVDKISKDKQVIIHCRSGARSGNMVQWLEKNHGFQNLYNLKGGILAWAKEIDPSMPTY